MSCEKCLDEHQDGFTLIELIVVLILLGIFAAVAVPKFMNMTADAKRQAMEGAISEGMATMNVAYAKLMMSSGSATTAEVATKAGNNKPASDEFSYSFANTGLVTVNGKSGSDFNGATAVTKLWQKP